MRHETLWEVTFSKEGSTRTINVACSEEQLIDTLKETMYWRSKNHTLTMIERAGTVRIAPSVDSQPKEAHTLEQTCTIWTASWLPQNI